MLRYNGGQYIISSRGVLAYLVFKGNQNADKYRKRLGKVVSWLSDDLMIVFFLKIGEYA